jgi:hypothetical protein
MKFFKSLFVIGGTALAGYLGLKLYKKISSITKLHKSLPEFLNNVYGEKPALHINHNLKTMSVKVGFSQEIIDKHTDIEATVKEYIDDFYPELSKGAVNIDIYTKGTEKEEENSCCCSDGDDEGDCCSSTKKEEE